jgi:osmotically-inducible protein OsmY
VGWRVRVGGGGLFVAWLVAGAGQLGCAGTTAQPLRLEPRADDPGIADVTARRIAVEPRLCRYDITVAVRDGTARLDGKVTSGAERRRAAEIARDAGAARVDDRLRIDPAAGVRSRC